VIELGEAQQAVGIGDALHVDLADALDGADEVATSCGLHDRSDNVDIFL